MVAAAAGLGFVLGGGLFRPLAARIFRTGVRLAILPLVRHQAQAILSPILDEYLGTGRGTERTERVVPGRPEPPRRREARERETGAE
jgi:hypothetical protein